ncbi:hypothetical protein ACFQ07_34175 [Actinomadura adrarensis]|uniref:Uncharacterized protein n=1 Tax=Actinomadura adrarensis TaxID=1819600 RepID=A0ABW3CRV7_9ACTN
MSAATITAAYPQIGLSLNVGAAVLGVLYAITRDAGRNGSEDDRDN